jgi:hypothetical protein
MSNLAYYTHISLLFHYVDVALLIYYEKCWGIHSSTPLVPLSLVRIYFICLKIKNTSESRTMGVHECTPQHFSFTIGFFFFLTMVDLRVDLQYHISIVR